MREEVRSSPRSWRHKSSSPAGGPVCTRQHPSQTRITSQFASPLVASVGVPQMGMAFMKQITVFGGDKTGRFCGASLSFKK